MAAAAEGGSATADGGSAAADGGSTGDGPSAGTLRGRDLVLVAIIGMATYAVAAFVVDARAHQGLYGALYDALWVMPFWDDARSLLQGHIPYVQIALEYPPLSLVAFVLPALISGTSSYELYTVAFEVAITVCGMLTIPLVVATVARLGGGRFEVGVATIAMVAAVPLIGPLAVSRYDALPALLTAGAVAAMVFDRHRIGYAMLALGVLAKVYPVFLLPVFLVDTWRRRGGGETLASFATMAVIVLVGLGPFVLAAGWPALDPFTRPLARPLQVESLGATLLILAHDVGHIPIGGISLEFGSYNLKAPLPSAVSTIQTVLLGLSLVATWWLYAIGRSTRARFVLASAAVLAVNVAFGKVLSPQYVIWLVPGIAVLAPVRGAWPLLVLAAVLYLTGLFYPQAYPKFLISFDLQATLTIVERNLALVLLAGYLVAGLASTSASTRGSGSRGRRIERPSR